MEAIINSHNITLTIDELTLRPMTDDDFDVLLKWNSDPDVLYFSEGDDIEKYSLEDVQGIYGYVSKMAFTFIIERHRSTYRRMLASKNEHRPCFRKISKQRP